LSKEDYDKKVAAAVELKEINFICYFIALLNKLFLYELIRSFCALVWGVANLLLALIIRPIIGNWVLFGSNANSKQFEYLEPLRKVHKKNKRFDTLAK